MRRSSSPHRCRKLFRSPSFSGLEPLQVGGPGIAATVQLAVDRYLHRTVISVCLLDLSLVIGGLRAAGRVLPTAARLQGHDHRYPMDTIRNPTRTVVDRVVVGAAR